IRTCGFPAYGSCLGCVTAQVAVYAPAPVTREPGSESSTCFAGAYSPWPPPFAPPTPLRPPPQTPPRWASLALFADFIATMTRSDFSCPCIIGYTRLHRNEAHAEGRHSRSDLVAKNQRLATSPARTASPIPTITIGIVRVAILAA